MSQKTPYFNVDVDETEDLVKGGFCEIVWGSAFNTHTAVQFLKLYDASSTSAVTVGTTTPTLTVAIPASSSVPIGGVSFTNGIVAAATLLAANNDATGPTAAVVLSLSTT